MIIYLINVNKSLICDKNSIPMLQQQILFQGSGKRIMESCCIHKKHHHECLSGMTVILVNSKVSICSLNNVQAQHFSDSVKSHKNGASLVIKLSTTVSRSMAEDEIQHCLAQKDKIKYCSVLCVFSMPGILLCNGFQTFFLSAIFCIESKFFFYLMSLIKVLYVSLSHQLYINTPLTMWGTLNQDAWISLTSDFIVSYMCGLQMAYH